MGVLNRIKKKLSQVNPESMVRRKMDELSMQSAAVAKKSIYEPEIKRRKENIEDILISSDKEFQIKKFGKVKVNIKEDFIDSGKLDVLKLSIEEKEKLKNKLIEIEHKLKENIWTDETISDLNELILLYDRLLKTLDTRIEQYMLNAIQKGEK